MAIGALGSLGTRNILAELTDPVGGFQRNLAQLRGGQSPLGLAATGWMLGPAAERMVGAFNSRLAGITGASAGITQGLNAAEAAAGGLSRAAALLRQGKDLAQQANADGTTAAQRASLQAQIEDVNKQLDKLAADTKSGGQTLLNGQTSRLTVTSSATGQQTTLQLSDVRAKSLGTSGADVTTEAAAAAASRAFDVALSRVTNAQRGVANTTTALRNAGASLELATAGFADQQQRLTTASMAAQVTSTLSMMLVSQSTAALLAQANVGPGSLLRLFGSV